MSEIFLTVLYEFKTSQDRDDFFKEHIRPITCGNDSSSVYVPQYYCGDLFAESEESHD